MMMRMKGLNKMEDHVVNGLFLSWILYLIVQADFQ